ncbi:Hypothetical protein D9617_6g093700 [Elsinoe fawcettii]|nr:Hypothetical protein D9617_6g093700 [Elsinoe fawcettii]
MNLSNGQAGNAPNGAKHARQNTRIIPVIPKRYSRKSTDNTGVKSDKKLPSAESTLSNSASTPQGKKDDSQQNANTNGEIRAEAPNDSEPAASEVNGDQILAEPKQPVLGAEILDPIVKSTVDERADGAGAATPTVDQETLNKLERPASNQKVSRPSSGRSPVELPPPFYPASHPASNAAVHGTAAAERSVDRHSFIFGGNVDSSAPSPIPPASAGSWNSSSGPGFHGDGAISPPVPANAFAPPPLGPDGLPNPIMPPQDSTSTNNRPTFPLPNFQPPTVNTLANGHGPHVQRQFQRERYAQTPRSGSVGSNVAEPPFPPQYASYPPPTMTPYTPVAVETNTAPQRAVPFSPFTPSFTPTRGSQQFDSRFHDQDTHNALALRSHTETLFGSSDFADVILEMPSAFNGPPQLLAHSFILSRSPSLRNTLLETTLSRTDSQNDGPRRLVRVPDSAIFRDGGLFPLAVRSLYGGNFIRREHLPGNLKSPKQVMEWVLSYAAAGWYLQVSEIATAGLALASELLIIDNVEVALGFALAEDKKQESINGVNGHQNGYVSDSPKPLYAPFAMDFLFAILRFITWPLVNNFEFDCTAPELDTLKRIPEQLKRPTGAFHSSRPSVSNPKLQGIQLGDFQIHSSINRTLSSILLSIPTFVLQALFNERAVLERLPPDVRSGLMRAVVEEREKRRQAAMAVADKLPEDELHDESIRLSLDALKATESTRPSSVEPTMLSIVVGPEPQAAARANG